MKPVGIFYATREGHTQRIAEHVAANLRGHGLEVQMENLLHDPRLEMSRYAAAILAASVHAGQHESEMVRFVKQHADELTKLPAAFLSVTLSEAGAERRNATPEEHARFASDVQHMLDHFFERTGWRPKSVKPVAGALLYSKYNFLVRFVMKRIARKSGAATDTSHDYEYTDWIALDRFIDQFACEAGLIMKRRPEGQPQRDKQELRPRSPQ
jgi:menaquinone-dependent protoporphyrinogen oxidase